MKKLASKTTKLTIAACCLLLSISFFVTVTYAWFTTNAYASANGITMQVAGEIPLKIYKELKTENEDISSATISATSVHIDSEISDGYSTIQPGSYGRFTYYAEYNTGSHTDSFHYNFSLKIVNNVYAEEEGYQSGVKEVAKEESLRFVNSHLLFFTNLSAEGVYSNWIMSDKNYEFNFVESESNYIDERTIYWVWVQDYDDLFGASTTLISAEDKAEITSYYSIEENRKYIFLNEEKSLDGYDGADYTIGTTLKYICFELKFS